jgi:2-dehydro-3-deoxyphosphogluconate aldolase / (4S)-4-hydroxy-2-oxoglutarate aldolase
LWYLRRSFPVASQGIKMESPTRRERAVRRIQQERISAIIRTDDQQLALNAINAAVEGGFRIVEFTLTTPGALELISTCAREDELLVGAGTVMSPEMAKWAVDAGASFLVSPIVDPAVIEAAASLDVATIPGAFTPTEMETAHRAGADFIKIFPAPYGGIEFVTAIRGPLPHLRLFPTAGVSAENITDYLSAGCAGAGFVRTLFTPQDMGDQNFAAIRQRAATIVQRVAEWRATHDAS